MKRRNRGQIIVLFVLSLVIIIGLAALGVDVGYMYVVRHELQRSADSGALAGASYFKETGYWSSVAGDPQMQIAEARAREFATKDDVINSPLDNTEVFVSFPEYYKIRVGTERTINLFFAKLFLGPTTTIHAYAIAEAYAVSKNVNCLVPWGMPAPWVDANGNDIFDDGDTFTWVDPNDPSALQNYKDTNCTSPITQWDEANHVIDGPQYARDDYLCDGSLQVAKLTPGPNDNTVTNERVPGNFYGMDYYDLVQSCPGMEKTHGADFYRYMIKHSCECTFTADVSETFPTVGDPLTTLPGNMVGPTVSPVAPAKYYNPDNVVGGEYYIIVDGKKKYLPTDWYDANAIMQGDPDSQWDYTNNHPSSPTYQYDPSDPGRTDFGDPNIHPWYESPRVVKLPIYSPDPNYAGSNGEYTPAGGGKTFFKPLGFVGFWIQDIQYFGSNNGSIVGRFITVPAEIGSGETGPAGAQILNIRLIE